ncbi:energy-coupling factor transporter ATP-binding protein EcfA2 [Streptomyces sp. V4I23]|nr:energy-coupling factor transporter ATP-binding protein EcfA2 [Streptomyces sp. V4I23]
MLNPTDEQTTAADTFKTGDHLALQAGAGTGKTSTLTLLAAATPHRRGRYIAFNKAIALDAATRFPPTVTCKTAHALAYAAVGHRYARRLGGPRQAGWRTGQALGITKPVHIGNREVTHKALSQAVLKTVTRYCHSADRTLTRHHVPRLRGLDAPEHHAQLADTVMPFARKAWADLQHPDDGIVRSATTTTSRSGPSPTPPSKPTTSSSTKPRTPTPSSNTSSTPSATTPNS